MLKTIIVLIFLVYCSNGYHINNQIIRKILNGGDLDAVGYVNTILRLCQNDMESLRNRTDMDFSHFIPMTMEVDGTKYILNATLQYLGTSQNVELINNNATYVTDSTTLNVTAAIKLPNFFYNIIVEIHWSGGVIITRGSGVSIRPNISASWFFQQNENGSYNLEIKHTEASFFGQETQVAVNVDILAGELLEKTLQELKRDATIAVDSVFFPFSDIISESTDKVNISDFIKKIN